MKQFSRVLKRHSKMLFDWARTGPLLRAIEKKVRPGDVVVDLGCGLGMLSLAAVHAGAKRVYAMDVDGEALDFAGWQARQLGMADKICFLEEHSFNIDLVEKADLLIQETIGALAFDENFLSTLIDAKKRFLKPNGKIIPKAVSLWGAPAAKSRKLLAKPARLAKIETNKVRQKTLSIQKTWRIKPGGISGILVWPQIVWTEGLTTSASPLQRPTHWGQTLLAGRGPKLTLKFAPHPKDPLHYAEVLWQIASP